MNVGELIEKLKTMDKDKVVTLAEPSGIGWTNIGKIEEYEYGVKIIEDDNGLFHES